MWIFTPSAFVSIVAHREQRDKLLVRARVELDIERVFAGYGHPIAVAHTPAADYPYRAVLPRALVATAIADRLSHHVVYDNFKEACQEEDRHDAYLRVWTAMRTFQQHRERPDESPYLEDGCLGECEGDCPTHQALAEDTPE